MIARVCHLFCTFEKNFWLWLDLSIAHLQNQWTELEKLIFFATYFSRTFAIRLQYFRRFLCFADFFVRFNQPVFVQWTIYCVLIEFARIFLVISIAKDFILTVKFQVFFLRNKQKALENAQICAYLCLKWLRLITPYFSMFLIIGTYFCKITVTSDVFIIFWHDKRTLHRSITRCDSDKTTTKSTRKRIKFDPLIIVLIFQINQIIFLLTVQYQRRIYSNVINFDQSIL